MKTLSYCTAYMLLTLLSLGGSAFGQSTILDTDFTAAEGYTDAKLQFQAVTPAAGLDGTWLGQVNADTGTPAVDTSGTGSVSHVGEGFFLRNMYNRGALGGQAGGDGSLEGGGPSHPKPAGFNIGDTVLVENEYRFELPNGTGNFSLLSTGIRHDFVNSGFNAIPLVGLTLGYNPFEAGTLKIFSNNTRAVFNGDDNPFALFVGALDVGIDNGWDGFAKTLPTDLVSDTIKLTWEAVYDGADTWTTTEMIVENVDTATILATASIDNPGSLESVTVAGSGSEGFYAVQLSRGAVDATSTIDTAKFVYDSSAPVTEGDFDEDGDVDGADFLKWQQDGLSPADLQAWELNYGMGATPPVSGISAVPEPSSMVLGLLGFALAGGLRRKRS